MATIQSLQNFVLSKAIEASDNIYAIAIAPDGKYFLAGGDEAAVHIYSMKTWKLCKTFNFESEVRAVVWHDKEVFSVGLKNGHVFSVQLWVRLQ
jgi:WD40 repeat protein